MPSLHLTLRPALKRGGSMPYGAVPPQLSMMSSLRLPKATSTRLMPPPARRSGRSWDGATRFEALMRLEVRLCWVAGFSSMRTGTSLSLLVISDGARDFSRQPHVHRRADLRDDGDEAIACSTRRGERADSGS